MSDWGNPTDLGDVVSAISGIHCNYCPEDTLNADHENFIRNHVSRVVAVWSYTEDAQASVTEVIAFAIIQAKTILADLEKKKDEP